MCFRLNCNLTIIRMLWKISHRENTLLKHGKFKVESTYFTNKCTRVKKINQNNILVIEKCAAILLILHMYRLSVRTFFLIRIVILRFIN